VRPRCFLGWWWDATALAHGAAGTPHSVEVVLPKLSPGQFQGLFWGNVETIRTDQVSSCEVVV
jgi:hypothetical protein